MDSAALIILSLWTVKKAGVRLVWNEITRSETLYAIIKNGNGKERKAHVGRRPGASRATSDEVARGNVKLQDGNMKGRNMGKESRFLDGRREDGREEAGEK